MYTLSFSILITLLSFSYAQPHQVPHQAPHQAQRIGVNFNKAIIPTEDILSGGPPPNGIPALGFAGDWRNAAAATNAPSFIVQEEAAEWLEANEPVIAMHINGEAKAYPLQILTFHEIINDTVGGAPVIVTYCPLCNSALAFDRRMPLSAEQRTALRAENPDISTTALDEAFIERYHFQSVDDPEVTAGLEVTFGVSGMLYNSNMLMFDSASSTLWSQLIGQAVVGQLAGTELLRYPAQILSFADFRAAYPEALVLSKDTGFRRHYGRNPYVGYDALGSNPYFPVSGDDARLAAKERVVSVVLEHEAVVYPFSLLREQHVIHDTIARQPIVVLWQEGTGSALDSSSIANGADVGAVGVFASVDTFHWDGTYFVDDATGSYWNIAGQAVQGERIGEQLHPVVHDNTLWFAWVAFKPTSRVYMP